MKKSQFAVLFAAASFATSAMGGMGKTQFIMMNMFFQQSSP